MEIVVSFNRCGERAAALCDEVLSVRRFAYGTNAGGINTGWGVIRENGTLRRALAQRDTNPRVEASREAQDGFSLRDIPEGTWTVVEAVAYLIERAHRARERDGVVLDYPVVSGMETAESRFCDAVGLVLPDHPWHRRCEILFRGGRAVQARVAGEALWYDVPPETQVLAEKVASGYGPSKFQLA